MNFLYKEGSTQAQEDEAKMILEVLDTAYPGHPWGVRVYDGGFFIRHLDFPSNWGMNCRHKTIYSASDLKRQIILLAGEWLERAGVSRGRNKDEEVTNPVEGIPFKDQPLEYRREVEQKNHQAVAEVIQEYVANTNMRDTPQQALKEEQKQNGQNRLVEVK
jgi:hypothetical protein